MHTGTSQASIWRAQRNPAPACASWDSATATPCKSVCPKTQSLRVLGLSHCHSLQSIHANIVSMKRVWLGTQPLPLPAKVGTHNMYQ
eukprot:scaffold87874_cov18-Tisochrysis_lutea.AAC.1